MIGISRLPGQRHLAERDHENDRGQSAQDGASGREPKRRGVRQGDLVDRPADAEEPHGHREHEERAALWREGAQLELGSH